MQAMIRRQNRTAISKRAITSRNVTLSVLISVLAGSLSTTVAIAQVDFTLPEIFAVRESANFVVTGSFNRSIDESVDIISVSGGTLLLGDGSGRFAISMGSPIDFGPGAAGPLLAADFDSVTGAGFPDVVAASAIQRMICVSLGDGAGEFQSAMCFPSGLEAISEVACGDLNNDDFLDVIVTHANQAAILLGNGLGDLLPPVLLLSLEAGPFVSLDDYDSDGDLDIALASQSRRLMQVLIGNGTGTQFERVTYLLPDFPADILSGDFNGDGIMDLALPFPGPSAIDILLGEGDATFLYSRRTSLQGNNSVLKAGDYDLDGTLDLAVAQVSSGRIIILTGHGNGQFSASRDFYITPTVTADLAAADFDGDQRLDLAAVYSGNSVAVMCNRTPPECLRGNVNAGSGVITDVLFINGESGGTDRTVIASVGSPLTVALSNAPRGPVPARYALWIWADSTLSPMTLDIGSSEVGILVNPTPMQPFAKPQPLKCLSGGLPSVFCTGLHQLRGAPGTVPWSLTRVRGLERPITLMLQGVVEDTGAASTDSFSVTNCAILTMK